jgi:hypothetical protein
MELQIIGFSMPTELSASSNAGKFIVYIPGLSIILLPDIGIIFFKDVIQAQGQDSYLQQHLDEYYRCAYTLEHLHLGIDKYLHLA